MALGGCHFININNNQMEDGVNVRGCIGEEVRLGRNVWGGRLPVIWGGILIDEKIRETGGPLALDGHHLKGGHNNQIKVGFDVGGDVGEETRPGRNVWGGVVSRNRASNRRRKKGTVVWSSVGAQNTKHNTHRHNNQQDEPCHPTLQRLCPLSLHG